MIIDYDKWKRALAMTESRDNEKAWGDDNHRGYQAAGRWQMHPGFVWQWGPDDVVEGWAWETVFEIALHAFFTELAPQSPSATQLAMWFHLHGNKGSGWDNNYADRFDRFYGGG